MDVVELLVVEVEEVLDVVVVVHEVVVVCFLVVVVVVDEVVLVVRRGKVGDVVVEFPGEVVVDDVEEVVDEEVVDDEVVDDEVVDEVDVVEVALSRSSESGDAVNSGITLTPSCAFFITSEKICAGNDPPVTARPLTLVIGRFSSGYPTHTPVASCGV